MGEDDLMILLTVGAGIALVVAILGGCAWLLRVAGRQQQKATDMIDRGFDQMDRTDELQRRTDALLTRWEVMADRAEGLLARWERQDPPPRRTG